jgi:uncharacterized protein
VAIVVVSDTSPIRALNHLSLLAAFRDLYGTITVPTAVADELRRPTSTCPAIEVTNFPFLNVRTPQLDATKAGIARDLDAGETQAILLGIEMRADLILADERKATREARRLGLNTIGVIGVLLDAKRTRLIQNVLPLTDQLTRELHFFISAKLRREIAQLAGENL